MTGMLLEGFLDVIVFKVMTDRTDYRWVLLKPDFLGAWKSVRLISNLAYLHWIIQENGKQILEKKIWAKRESGLTAVRLKWDPPVAGEPVIISDCQYRPGV